LVDAAQALLGLILSAAGASPKWQIALQVIAMAAKLMLP
jgi:hypothetical protein